MEGSNTRKVIKLDGRTGEGGGQLCRLAIGLASITGTAVCIDHVRGNRESKRGGGLKAQHTACIMCLAEATNADLVGCSVGSKSFEFTARRSPGQIVNRNIRVRADSAASILLVFQAVLPFLLFAGDDKHTPITITIQGGTNVSFSLSYEYFDQVLAPALETFGINIQRKLEFRGWSHGTRQIGSVKFTINPIEPGQTLKAPDWPNEQGELLNINVTMIVPRHLQEPLKKQLLFELDLVFPSVDKNFVLVEDSKHNTRNYLLLVGHTSTGLRFGRDWLYDGKTKDKPIDTLCTELAERVVDALDAEIRKGGVVDEYLQDQLIVFQALADGRTSLPSTAELRISERSRIDRTDEPFGDGSLHTTTARWVTSQFLPQIEWMNGGRICSGSSWRIARPGVAQDDIEIPVSELEHIHII